MKRIAILLLAVACIVNDAYAQNRIPQPFIFDGDLPSFTNPGPDPRGRSVRPFNPLWGVLVIRIEQIDTAPRKTVATRIDRLRAKIEAETDDDKRKKLQDQLVGMTAQAEKTADWIIKGPGMGWEPGGRILDFGSTTLRVSKRLHRNLHRLKVGDYVAAENPHEEDPTTYSGTTVVKEITQPSWWSQQQTGPAVLPARPKIQHPLLNKLSPTKYQYHPVPAHALEGDTEDVVERVLPAVFSYSSDGITLIAAGFIINEEGIAITNRHVVESDRKFQAKLKDGRTVHGIVIGVVDNPSVDLALVDLEGDGYPFIPLGTAADLQVGEEIILIGAPEGLEHTVSKGIVSSLREIRGVRFIQTDAATNPGNSGGPMIRRTGAVVGVMTWIWCDTEGLNFAISIDEAIDRLPLVLVGTP